MGEPVVALAGVTVARGNGPPVLRDLSWTVREGEAWAVVGPTASGKSTLLETLLGRHRLVSGEVRWPLLDRLRAGGRGIDGPGDVCRLVAFQEDSRLFRYAGHYYQQRFEFADAEEPLSLADYLRAGSAATDEQVRAAADDLGVGDRLGQPFMTLSNGQTRRARIARALLADPEVLLLDDPFLGLDAEGRGHLTDLLGGLVRRGRRLVLACRREAVPGWATGLLGLGGRDPSPQPPPRSGEGEQSSEPGPVAGSVAPPRFGEGLGRGSSPVIDLRDVTVRHGGRVILDHVSWTVGAGERWALVGPNGAGKTTLLSLVVGDHPQAFSNHVELFGRRRGSGETIWEVKRNVGFVSPEFHLYFAEDLSGFEAAATGFHDVLLYREPTAEQAAAVRGLFAAFGREELLDRRFRRLSTGEQRLVLLVRALVKRPPLLVLDEPFQGLDAATAGRVRAWLDAELRPDQTLIFVTHLADEIPATVTRTLRIAAGRAAEVV